MLFRSQSYSAALAALLAEHDLGYIVLVPQNSFAAQLKEGIVRAFRVGAREGDRFDRQDWTDRFNHSSRLVQLNFVAFGLNELGHVPMLEGAWPRVNNPTVLNNIEAKLDQAQQYIKRRYGTLVTIRNSQLELKDWGLADQLEGSGQEAASAPNLAFVGSIPDSDFSQPVEFKFGDVVIAYYENPRTLGEKVGIPPIFKYLQLAVVQAPGATDSHRLIVRVEASGIGAPMLCSLDPTGHHRVLGDWSNSDRDSFVRKVAEVAAASRQSLLREDRHGGRAVVECPSCGRSLRVPKLRSGKIRCPLCQHLFEATT